MRFSSDSWLSGTDGCNSIGVRIEARGSQLSSRSFATTAVLCPDIIDFTEMVRGVLRGPMSWEVSNETLQLTGTDGTRLSYRRRPSIYPSDRPGYPAPDVLLEGRHGSGDYRLYYGVSAGQVSLGMESRDAPGRGWGFRSTSRKTADAGPQPDPMSCMTTQVAGERFVAGLVDGTVTRVVFRVLDTDLEIDVPLYRLAETEIRAFATFVGDPPRGSQLLAYDTDGAVLGPPYAPHWWVVGDPI